MKTTKYAITFTDSNNQIQLLTKDARIAQLDQLPLYQSEANAKAARTWIMNRAGQTAVDMKKHFAWSRETATETTTQAFLDRCAKDYHDAVLIEQHGIEIREVIVEVQL